MPAVCEAGHPALHSVAANSQARRETLVALPERDNKKGAVFPALTHVQSDGACRRHALVSS